MTDTTISTDPATLRDLAATLRMDEVRVCPHYLKLDLLADTYDAIAAEKEAQAAPAGDLVETVALAIGRAYGTTAAPLGAADAALSAIAAAGYEIRPRGETAADLTRRLAEVTAERDEWLALAKRFETRQGKLVVMSAEVRVRAETAEAALSRRDEALRVAREALATILDDNSEIRHPCDPPRPGHFGSIAKDAIAKIDALTKPQEAKP
jgi:hypothetical protein